VTGGGAGEGTGGTTGGSSGAGAGGVSGRAQGGTAGDGAGQGGGSSGAGAGQGGSSGSSGSSGAGAGGSGGDLDVFGIRQLYPSSSTGAEWTSEHWDGDAYSIDDREDPNDPSGLSGFRGEGSLDVTGDGELVMGGSQPRIYIYPGTAPWRDLEITVYYQRVEDSGTAYAGLVIGVRSGEDGHSTGTECEAHTYYARVRNDGAFDFEKELKHPASATQSRIDPDTAWPPNGDVPYDTWIGFKFVIYNVGSTVKFEAYRDMTNGENGGDWELVNETVDDGGWSVETDCAAHSPSGGESDMIVLDGGTTMIRNTDVTEARYRWVTMREIAPP